MTKENIRKVILKAIDPCINIGDTFRLLHEYRLDGSPCSLNKDPALSITRTKDGWTYFCHRCKTQGFIAEEDKSPKEVDSMIKRLQNPHPTIALARVVLPHDFVPICKDFDTQTCDFMEGPIPIKAYRWLWKYVLSEEDIDKFNIGWSDLYNRVIIPIYEYGQFGDTHARKLVGWIGRELDCQDKEERRAKKVAKYITRKNKKEDRILFFAPGKGAFAETYVIVEDIISAIKVQKATGMTVVALLSSHVSSELMKKCQGRRVYIWLDRDMLAKAIGYTTRFKQFGINASVVKTLKDPKEYNSFFIRRTIATTIVEVKK